VRDCSNKKANLNGYICLVYSILWGLYAVVGFWLKEKPSDTDGFGKVNECICANRLCFDKLFWIFFASGLVGDWIETLFIWATTGKLMSCSGLLYGTY
jgi:hypothetical protein